MPELSQGSIYRLEAYFHDYNRRHPKWPVLLSEGDSWFSLEVRGNTIDHLPESGPFSLLRLEQSGDELLRILGGSQKAKLRRLIEVYPVQALLFSAGGNDFIGPDFGTYLRPYEAGATAADLIDSTRFSRRLDQLEAAYRDLLDLLDDFRVLAGKKRRDVQLLVHGYGHAIPSERPVRYLFLTKGPWMIQHFRAKKIVDPGLQREVVRIMIDRFNDRLAQLASHPAFVHVDLRDVLGEKDWGDEIHPSRKGYRKAANRFREELARLFPGYFTQEIKP